MLTKKALDLEASNGTNAEILCNTYIPTRSTVSIPEKMIELRSLYSRVVCAGIAKLVVFYKIVYGMRFPSTAGIPERKSSNTQYTDSNHFSDLNNGDPDLACTYQNPTKQTLPSLTKPQIYSHQPYTGPWSNHPSASSERASHYSDPSSQTHPPKPYSRVSAP